MSATVKDVAKLAQVSAATVSRVVNLDARISPETTRRVNFAIQQLGYSVNHLARGLKTRQSHTVGLIVPEFRNDFFMGVAQGVEEALQTSGFSLMICNASETAAGESQRVSLLLEKRVDGVIVIPSTDTGSHLARLTVGGVPVVLVDRAVTDFAADTVLVDNVNGTYRAVEQALRSGARRIGFLGGDQRLTSARERYEGYRRALQDYQIAPDPTLERFGDFHAGSGYQLMGELLALPQPPSVVFISNYFMHVGASRLLTERATAGPSLGSKIPAPCLVSFDDLELSFALGFSRILVRQPTLELGRQAASLLLDRLKNRYEGPARVVRLPTELVVKPGYSHNAIDSP